MVRRVFDSSFYQLCQASHAKLIFTGMPVQLTFKECLTSV